MFDPTNDFGEELAVFRVSLSDLNLTPDQWHTLRFDWDLSNRLCSLKIGDQQPVELPVRHPTINGLSYVRFRSTAKEMDPSGLLVEQVTVKITDPFAPACSAQEQRAHEQRYVKEVVPNWKEL